MLDEMDLNEIRKIQQDLLGIYTELKEINTNLKNLILTLECFGDFKP